MPSTGSITNAKARLGAEPFRLLFARTAVPSGTPDTPGVFFEGLRVTSVDGFTLDVPDSTANAAYFGRGGNGSASANPHPQLRALVLVLVEGGTMALLGAAYGPSAVGEQTLAVDLLAAVKPGTLLLADRKFAPWTLWRAAAGTGAELCWRMSAAFKLPVVEVLPDGTYLSELRPPRRAAGGPIRVRVVGYSVQTTDPAGVTTSEVFALATTLTDTDRYPGIDLAELYHDRWQAETGIGDLKTAIRSGPQIVLRSKYPAMVEQEL